ncbi:MAG: hypothetical protein AVDCRST_MAG03-2583, partial [uncultured Rubrobacteraceae bacterium]
GRINIEQDEGDGAGGGRLRAGRAGGLLRGGPRRARLPGVGAGRAAGRGFVRGGRGRDALRVGGLVSRLQEEGLKQAGGGGGPVPAALDVRRAGRGLGRVLHRGRWRWDACLVRDRARADGPAPGVPGPRRPRKGRGPWPTKARPLQARLDGGGRRRAGTGGTGERGRAGGAGGL